MKTSIYPLTFLHFFYKLILKVITPLNLNKRIFRTSLNFWWVLTHDSVHKNNIGFKKITQTDVVITI